MLCPMHARLRTRALWCSAAAALAPLLAPLLWLAVRRADALTMPAYVWGNCLLVGLGVDSFLTVARCTAHGRTGTVAVPWLLAVDALSPVDLLAYSYGWPVETIYWLLKVLAAVPLSKAKCRSDVDVEVREINELKRAIRRSGASHYVQTRMEKSRLKISPLFEHQLPAIRRLLADQAQPLRRLVADLRASMWMHTQPAAVVFPRPGDHEFIAPIHCSFH